MKRTLYLIRHEVTLCMFLLYLLLYRYYESAIILALIALYGNTILYCLGFIDTFKRTIMFYLYNNEEGISKIPIFVEKSIDIFLTVFNIIACYVFYYSNYSILVLLVTSLTIVIVLSVKIALNYLKF